MRRHGAAGGASTATGGDEWRSITAKNSRSVVGQGRRLFLGMLVVIAVVGSVVVRQPSLNVVLLQETDRLKEKTETANTETLKKDIAKKLTMTQSFKQPSDDSISSGTTKDSSGPQLKPPSSKRDGDDKQASTETQKRHSCINKDFVNTYDKAVFTLLIPSKEEYITAASVLGASLDLRTNQTDKVILELPKSPLSRFQWARLQRAGWTHKCTIEPIRATKRPSPRFVDQFAKLRVWGMTVYDVAVYMDADTFVMGNIDDLLHIQLGKDFRIGVAADFRMNYGDNKGEEWVSSFNMGVFAIHPDWTEYERLLQLQRDGAVKEYEHIMAEQGWLNAVYKDQWQDFGLIYNANVAARDNTIFKKKQDDLRIVHYTTMKPWVKDQGRAGFDLLCRPWVEVRNRVLPQYGCTNDDFVPPSDKRIAMVTFVTDTVEKHASKTRKKDKADYTYGAAALIKSIQEHVGDNKVDSILLEIPTRRLPDADRAWLKELGWNMCTVTPIEAKHKPFGRFVDQFNKLHLWSFVEYDKIVYLDSDNLVTGSIDALLQRNLTDGKKIGVTQDYFANRFVDKFNMGVFLIEPNLAEFHRLVKLQANDEVKYDRPQAEQGFLNTLYKNQWEEIGIEYNANMAVWAMKREAWPKNPRITHFTLEKPWQEEPPKHRSQSIEPLDIFLNTWKEAARKYEVWPYDW